MGKIIVFDIEICVESYPSKGPFGGQRFDGKNAYLLSFNHKELGDPGKAKGLCHSDTRSFKKDFQNDKDLAEYAYKVLTDKEVTGYITFYGSEFDIPLLNTRFQFHGLPTLPQMPHDDIHKIFKSRKGKLSISSYSLDYLCEFYKLPRKTKVKNRDWILAKAGNVESLKKISTYGKNDVEITELLYHKAKSLNGSNLAIHPTKYVGDKPCNCSKCGSNSLKRSGRVESSTSWKWRYRCNECDKSTVGKDKFPYE